MKYFELEPQCSGTIGESAEFEGPNRSGKAIKMAYDFETWPEDCLIEAVGNFIVTEDLKNALESVMPPLTGFEFGPVEITTESQFDELYGDRILPKFIWLKVHGKAGNDDFGQSKNYTLVVSGRVMDVLNKFPRELMEAEEYRS